MWRLEEEAGGRSAAENGRELKRRLEALVGKIPEIAELEVGLNLNTQSPAAFDVVLYSVFADAAAPWPPTPPTRITRRSWPS